MLASGDRKWGGSSVQGAHSGPRRGPRRRDPRKEPGGGHPGVACMATAQPAWPLGTGTTHTLPLRKVDCSVGQPSGASGGVLSGLRPNGLGVPSRSPLHSLETKDAFAVFSNTTFILEFYIYGKAAQQRRRQLLTQPCGMSHLRDHHCHITTNKMSSFSAISPGFPFSFFCSRGPRCT